MKQTTTWMAIVCTAWFATACKTVNLRTENLSQSRSMEHFFEAKADSLSYHTADSVFVLVEKNDSMTHIVKERVHWRERVKVQKDTVMVYIRTDTLAKETSVVEKPARSPPARRRFLITTSILAAIAATVLFTIKKHLLS